MSDEYIFLAHYIFDYYYNQLIEAKPNIEESLRNQIRMIKLNPMIGKPLKGAPPQLQGRIRKRNVGGRKGHRLFYITFPGKNFVIGVFITPETRNKINYNEFPWDKFLEAFQDFETEKLDKFRII